MTGRQVYKAACAGPLCPAGKKFCVKNLRLADMILPNMASDPAENVHEDVDFRFYFRWVIQIICKNVMFFPIFAL